MKLNLSFEDQCSPANPRMPLVADMKQILIDSFKGIKFNHSITPIFLRAYLCQLMLLFDTRARIIKDA